MTWDSADTYRAGLEFFGTIVESVPADLWQRASPCEGWRAVDVLGHVGEATAMGTRILAGDDMSFERADPPGSVVDGDPVAWWQHLADAARAAIDTVDDLDRVVNSPMGPRSVREGLSFPAVDLFLHGWDLGVATGQSVTIPAEAIAFTRALFEHVPEDVARRPGVFGSRQDVSAGAAPTELLIAFSGRDPNWKPTV